MPRSISTNFQQILDGPLPRVNWTIDIKFPNSTSFYFGTADLALAKATYTNDLQSVGDIRQSLESPMDRVRVSVQNHDRVMSEHLIDNWKLWRRAEAVVGRHYVGGANYELEEWKFMFQGVVQQPEADDFTLQFETVTDTVATGQIVCARNLDPRCWFVFKASGTCGYVGSETECNHHLKSTGGCDGRNNAEHYGGMEHRYKPAQSIPGSGTNPSEPPIGGPIGGGPLDGPGGPPIILNEA